jgi:hypothetical protein
MVSNHCIFYQKIIHVNKAIYVFSEVKDSMPQIPGTHHNKLIFRVYVLIFNFKKKGDDHDEKKDRHTNPDN